MSRGLAHLYVLVKVGTMRSAVTGGDPDAGCVTPIFAKTARWASQRRWVRHQFHKKGKFTIKEIAMKTNRTMLCVLGSMLLFTIAAASAADAKKLKFNFKDVHANKTAIETDTYAVNNAGVIAGDYVDSAGVQRGMILAGKKLRTIDNPKNCNRTATTGIQLYGINSANTAVGWCVKLKSQTDLAFSYSYANKKLTPISYPESIATDAWGINDNGVIVGDYTDTAGNQHGFVKIGKKYTTIDVPGDTFAAARGINNKGDFTVYAINSSGGWDSFLYTSKGKHIKISDPNAGSEGNVIHGVNNKGDIDGVYYDSIGNQVGFLLHGGKYQDVKDPKADNSTRADGINDNLEIVGRYSPASGANVGFKATTTQ